MGCDGHRPSDVSETIGVMGIHQDIIGRVARHRLFRSPPAFVLQITFFANPLYHIRKATSNRTIRFALRGIRFAAIWHIVVLVNQRPPAEVAPDLFRGHPHIPSPSGGR